MSQRKIRDEAIQKMTEQELRAYVVQLAADLAEAKGLLRTNCKKFRWLAQDTMAQDIDKFLDRVK